jgi:mono/diheme cytochrome c family protein
MAMSKPAHTQSLGQLNHVSSHDAFDAQMIALAAILALAVVIIVALALLLFARPSAAAQSPADGNRSEHSDAADVARGKKLFVSYGCYECHGRAAQGGVGPRLGPDPLPLSFIEKYVRHPTASMPPYTEKTVSDQDLASIYAYLKSLPEPPKEKDIPLLNE